MMKKSDDIEAEDISKMEEGGCSSSPATTVTETPTDAGAGFFNTTTYIAIAQKLVAEVIGTYFVIFAGCGSVAVNKIYGSVTFPGICVTWGLIVMAMIYCVGHISGAHFNPAVTLTLSVFQKFPLREVPLYWLSQLMGSVLASETLALLFHVTPEFYFGTVPVGSNVQSLILEIIISFLLMFVVCGATTDERSITDFGGVAVGMTILLNVFVAGPVSGASMNPARSLGPAIIIGIYKGLWVYIVGPFIGCLAGGLAYHLLRLKDTPSIVGNSKSKSPNFKNTSKM